MKFANLLKDTTTATSTASMTLAGAPESKYRSLVKAISLGKMAVGDIACFKTEDAVAWEESSFRIDGTAAAPILTRVAVLDSSNDGAAITFAAGVKTVSNMIPAELMSKILSTDDGIASTALSALGSVAGTTKLLALDASGGIVTAAVSLLPSGGSATPADGTAPTTPGNLSSSGVGQTSATLNYTASTDNVGVSYYEVSKDGITWTNNGTALSYTFSPLTAATTYTFQVRAVDAAGNKSTAASLPVTTAAANGDTTAPSMAGSITTPSVSDTGFTMAYSAGSDNVAVTLYQVSTDGGTTWINNGTSLSYAKTGATASTLYNLRVRCYDAAGNVSNVLSGTVTTNAATPQTAYTIAKYSGTGMKAQLNAATLPADQIYATRKVFKPTDQQDSTIYWTMSPNTAASAKSGWVPAGTVPDDTFWNGSSAPNTGGDAGANCAVPMTHPSAWGNVANLWVLAGSGTSNWDYYIKPNDGAAQKMGTVQVINA